MKSPEARIAELEAEVEQLRAEKADMAASQTTGHPRRRVAWKSVFSNTLLTLGLIALVPAGLLVWLNRTVVSPEAYIASVGPVIEQPAVQAAIQKKASEELFGRVDVAQVVGEALPERAQFLAEPIAAQVKNYANTTIGRIVASPQFAQVWVEANTQAQATFMKIATTSNGSPDIDLNRVYAFISTKLESTPLAGLANRDLPPQIGNIQVATVPALERIPQFVANLNAWRWWLVALAVGLLALAVGVAKNRRRSLVWVGFGAIAAAVVTLIIVRVTRVMMLDPISDPVYRDAAVAVWQTILTPFLWQLVVMSLLGLAVLVVAWLAGPGRVATTFRSQSQDFMVRARTGMAPNLDHTPVVAYLARYHQWFRWGLVVATAAVLLASVPLTVQAVAVILIVALLLLALLEFLTAGVTATKPAHSKT